MLLHLIIVKPKAKQDINATKEDVQNSKTGVAYSRYGSDQKY